MNNKITIGFLGDVYVSDQKVAPKVCQALKDILNSCDHVIANLEGPITKVNSAIAKKGAVMKQTSAVIDLFKECNVNVVGLANNHISDHGEQGITDTTVLLEQEGFHYGGAGLDIKDIYKPVKLNHASIKVSLLFGGENGFGCLSNSNRGKSGYAWLFHPYFFEAVNNEVKQSDFVVVIAHAGLEHMDRPLPQWRWTYQKLIEMGVSAVIAHHPHLTQGYEIYNGAPIFYSIGNFYFYKRKPQPKHCFHAQVPILEFNKNDGITFKIMHTCFELGIPGTIELNKEQSGTVRTDRLVYELSSCDYRRLLENDLLELWKTKYGPSLDVSINAFTSRHSFKRFARKAVSVALRRRSYTDPMYFEHLLDIESHRWAMAETMRILYKKDN